jgi:hypothetical protein
MRPWPALGRSTNRKKKCIVVVPQSRGRTLNNKENVKAKDRKSKRILEKIAY